MEKKKRKAKEKNALQQFVQGIQKHEKGYTIGLIVIFLVVFGFVGYRTFSIGKGTTFLSDMSFSSIRDEEEKSTGISTSFPSITLTEESILTDEEGFLTEGYPIVVHNSTSQLIEYRILFEKDDFLQERCGCKDRSFSLNDVRYSLDGKTAQFLYGKDNILLEGSLETDETRKENLRVWLSYQTVFHEDYHLHGKLKLEILSK